MYQRAAKLKDDTSHRERGKDNSVMEYFPHILVVDDAAVDLEVMTHILTKQGYRVSRASSSHQALDAVAFEVPDLIILDVKMPDIDGYEICQRLKSNRKISNVPVIFISALDESEDIIKGFNAGGVDYITKPFRPAEILTRVETHLALDRMKKKIEAKNTMLQKEITERKHTEEKLKQAYDNLERIVDERTVELTKKNKHLLEEIEERKRAEDALRDSEERFRSVVDNVCLGIALISPNMEILTLNNQMKKWFPHIDVSKKPICYKAYNNPPRETLCSYCPTCKTLQDGQVYESVTDTPVMGSDIRKYRIISSPIKDTQGNIIAAIEMVEDITESGQMQEKLRESEQRLSDIIDFLPDATFVIDLQGKVIAWNRAIEEMTGVKAEDILGKGDYEYSIPFYGIRRPIMIDMVFRNDEEIKNKYLFVEKNGNVFLSEANVPLNGKNRVLWGKASPLYDSDGKVVGAIQSIRDVTERKGAEKALKKRERELEMKSRSLEELNSALNVLLRQREMDKDELEERTLSNVKHLILPYIDKLKKSGLETKDEAYISIVETNLKDIVSPFSQKLSTKYISFTPKELQVANLIKEGRTTKEIAELFNTSPGTIDFHRNNIRTKLNLKNRKANLKAYLITLA